MCEYRWCSKKLAKTVVENILSVAFTTTGCTTCCVAWLYNTVDFVLFFRVFCKTNRFSGFCALLHGEI